jgi:hypothetical protein
MKFSQTRVRKKLTMNYIERDTVLVITLQEITHINNLIIMIRKNHHNLTEEQTITIRVLNKTMSSITSMIF